MLKKILLYSWLLAPVALLAFHYGPGQTELARDAAAQKLAAARAFEQAENWHAAAAAYSEALAALPATDREARWQLRLDQNKARMQGGDLPEALADMENLLVEMQKEGAQQKQIDDVRANVGMASYYAAWLMRLEGASTEEWTIETENARQHFRLLSEEHLKGDSTAAKAHQENLEATVRLARMDLSELQGMPLPKMCQGCKDVSQKCRSQREGQCKKPAEKEPKDARGAGTGQRPRGGS